MLEQRVVLRATLWDPSFISGLSLITLFHWVSLYRKLNTLMEEYITRVGQQACIVYCTPGKSHQQPSYYKVVGSQPLENVVS